MRTAFLVDGGFFLKRYYRLQGSKTPLQAAQALHRMCRDHLIDKPRGPNAERRQTSHLYRIFYYDCPPLTKKVHNPITGHAIVRRHVRRRLGDPSLTAC